MYAHKRDALHPIWSKLEYGEHACIVWLYNAMQSTVDLVFLAHAHAPLANLTRNYAYRTHSNYSNILITQMASLSILFPS